MERGGAALVGREAELRALRTALDEAVAGRPHMVVCSGEAGIGKTRLLTEVAQEAEQRGLAVLWARSLELADAPPYWLWRQVSDSAGGSVDRAGLFEGIVESLAQATDVTGGLLVVDDIQWADEPSLVALLHVVRSLRGRRLLICAAERPHRESPGWRAVKPRLLSEGAVESIAVQGLSLEETERYLTIVAGREIDTPFARTVRNLTGGNPFYIRELGRSVPSVPGATSPVLPPRLVDVVHARIEALSPATRELLVSTSILGEEFSLVVAASLVERTVLQCLPAVDEAIRAGVLTTNSAAGRVAFAHGIVRTALVAELPLERRVGLHVRAAHAIEELFADDIAEHFAELARHWGEVAITGDREPAARWARRAADHAAAGLAHEEADRLYGLALEYSPAADSPDRARLLLAKSLAAVRSGRLAAAGAVCVEAFSLARRLQDATLMAEAVLVLEPIGERRWDRDLRDRCEEALAHLTDTQSACCARVLARKAETLLYLGEYAEVRNTSATALRHAFISGDRDAFAAALNARQLACGGPEYVKERETLAARMIEVGLQSRNPAIELRGRLWAADTHWQCGRLDEADRTVAALAWCVERVGGPVARWHLLVAQAACAQARADFETALRLGGEAYALLARLEHPAAYGAYSSLLTTIGHHYGYAHDPELRLPSDRLDDVRNELFSSIGPAFAMLGQGRTAEAEQLYRRAGAPPNWVVPPYFALDALAVGAHLAVASNATEDIEYFHRRLASWRDHHIASGTGGSKYFGPVELVLGKTAAALSRWEDAETDLVAASRISAAIGAPAFAVEAEAERALLGLRRGDAAAARAIAGNALPKARVLSMTPWIARLEQLLETTGAQPLSPREQEVAALVAAGHSNREIARTLVISERTAQNHVQHILVKLGYTRRSQIAAWAARR
ncbi:ATP-binding protein [Nocardia vinacea]|uniref:ATP-binding protein n=1 Tax=Nocardia vinacea TaxID=96468 RepID=UPI0003018D7B|nr:LuxR family transcriptional regulator [Nocardia vinacea]